MSTCGPGHLATASSKGVPELLFVASAIKACYGSLGEGDESECETGDPDAAKRPRLQTGSDSDQSTTCNDLHSQYTGLYNELKHLALSDIKTLVRKHVEGVSNESASYRFMNIYGLCTFDPPNTVHMHAGEPAACEFTKLSYPHNEANTNSPNLVTVSGVLSPLLSARLHHGKLEFTDSRDSDYNRAVEEYVRLDARSKMRVPRVIHHGNLGGTLGSMEGRFLFTIREDLHALGLTYRHILVTIELLHINMLHFIHS